MKYFLSCIALLCVATSHAFASDYFEEDILGADPETAILQEITIKPMTLKDYAEMKRYNSTAIFVESIKMEATRRFQDGSIPLYRRYDIITNLDSFVYTMNQYFMNQKRYEQTKKTTFRDSARSYLQDSR